MRRLALAIVAAAACGDSSLAPPIVSLAEPVVVSADGPTTSGGLRFSLTGFLTTPAGERVVTLSLPQASASLRSDGTRAWLQALSAPLGDLALAPDLLPPTGLSLRELALGVTAAPRAPLAFVDDDGLAFVARAPLRIDWKMELPDGTRFPLGPMTTPPLELAVQVRRWGTETTLYLQASCEGPCWSLPGVVSLHDAALELVLPCTVAPD